MAGWLKAELLMMRGKFHLRDKNYESALRHYRKVTELRPDYARGFAQVGYCLNELGRYQEAIVAYERVLQIDPKSVLAYAYMSLALEHLGDTRTASEFLERALRNSEHLKNPGNAAYWRAPAQLQTSAYQNGYGL